MLPNSDLVVQTEELSKVFRVGFWGNRVTAVDGIKLEVRTGEVFGFLGPNGAGQSTTIKILTGILVPSSGEVHIAGRVPWNERVDHVRGIGVVFGQRTNLWWDLPVIESFKILKEIYKVDQKTFDEHMGMFNELVGLKELYSQQVRTLSLGQRMLCDITASFLHNPQTVFLDEPTSGVDPITRRQFWGLIYEAAHNGITVFVTTHYMDEAEILCDRVAIIDSGKIIAIATPDKLIDDLVATGFERPKELKKASLEDVFLHLTGHILRED